MAWQSGWEFLEGVGQSDKFGSADYAKALQQGKSKAQIRDYVQGMYDSTGLPGGGQYGVRAGNQTVRDLIAKDSGFTSSLGQAMGSGLSQQQQTHFGGADLLHAQATIADQGGDPWSGASAIRIDDYSSAQPRSSGYMNTRGYNVQAAASGQRAANSAAAAASAQAAWQKSESEKRAAEAAARLQQMKDAEEARRVEALKVRGSASQPVGSRGVSGIKIKESPGFLGGMRGTGQLARSDKGTQLKTLNV